MPRAASLADALRDRYAVERELGRGGMATVYLARDLKHERFVALKVLHPELAYALGSDRFLREIKLAARLQHPHILSVHDSGETQGFLWFTMPFVAGESLRDRLRREKQLPVDDALRIAIEAARALDYAHREGVIHRDIKPENILLTQDGDTLVADFGIGRALGTPQSGDTLTESGVIVGTPAYMSPEQSAGERDLDGRTDIYSLGVVLYEMLAGEPPFTGPTAQAIMAHRLTGTPRPVHELRELVPEQVEQALSRSLARVPADRFSSARDFAAALTGAATPPPGGSPVTRVMPKRSRRWLAPAAAAAIAVLGVGVVSWLRTRPTTPLNADLVAVAPFDVLGRGRDLDLWREGLVDVLARNLDGAGPLRTVSPTVVIRRWRGRAEAESATDLGRRTGARLVVFGQLVGTSGDSVRLSATLHDASRGVSVGEVDLRGSQSSVDRLADSLTIRLLRELGRTRPIGAARLATFGSGSLPALKAFLQGEQEYRRSNWDSALVDYRRAIELDTAFALAYSRLGTILGWQRTAFDSLSDAYILKAGALNHGLAPRESLLIAADSVQAYLFSHPPGGLEYRSGVRRLFRILDEAAARYPDDPLVWHAVGEARMHTGFFLGASPAWALQPFERAIAADSAFAPAYIHPVELALHTDGPDTALRYVNAYLALGPTDKHAGGMRLLRALLSPDSTSSAGLNRWLDTASANELSGAYLAMWAVPDSAEVAVRLARLLAEGRPGEKPWSEPAMGRRQLVRTLLRRGHLREARVAIGDAQDWPTRWDYTQAVMLGGVPPDSAALIFRRWLREGGGTAALPLWWWAERRDTASIRQFMVSADSLLQAGSRPVLSFYAQAAPAYLTLARRDTARALQEFLALPDSLCMVCALERLTRVRLLTAKGRDQEAAARLEAPITNFPEALEVVWALERGRVNERLGKRDKAVEAYSFVAKSWIHADPQLQPVVAETRTALARLTEEPKR
jgi:eukaryotic-like serine/threonine-protein kinase